MRRIEEARKLIESLQGQDLSDAELIKKCEDFFKRDFSELDAEFATGMMKTKAAAGGDAVLPLIFTRQLVWEMHRPLMACCPL